MRCSHSLLTHSFHQSTVANLQPNSFTQILALSLLTRWGYQGLFDHVARVAEFYRKKRDVFQEAMVRHLSGIAEWSVPEAGMFMWCVFFATLPPRALWPRSVSANASAADR